MLKMSLEILFRGKVVFTSLLVFWNILLLNAVRLLIIFSGTTNLQRSALGEIKNTRSQSINSVQGQEAKAFKQPLKPSLTRKAKEKENAEVPELPKNDQIEAMETSSQAVESAPQETGIEDIDIEDAGNPQLVVEYVQDIYNYLR